MSKSSTPTFIVIRRNKKAAHGHHGGAWKIAYADFVTAMMAFFLLMWLLSSVTKAELSSVETYFRTPLKVAPVRATSRAFCKAARRSSRTCRSRTRAPAPRCSASAISAMSPTTPR